MKPEAIIDSLSFQVTNLKYYSKIKNFTIILITIFTNIVITGNTQDFTASISGKQNAIVLTPDNDNDDSNSPCPSGWNVASKNDFDVLLSNNNSSNDLFKSQLRIPASGYRNGSSGNIEDEGNRALLWTSSSSGKKAIALEADNNQVKQKKFVRANGIPVRCVKSE